MLNFKGKCYYSPIEASEKFKISLSTLYYWIRKNEFKDYLLNLKKFGTEKEIAPEEFRAEFYIEEKILKEKARFLNYSLTEIYSKKREN